jgi:hypothetical protein
VDKVLTAVKETQTSPWLRPYHFQPGQSGNPGGRKKKPLTEALEAELTPQKCKSIAEKMVAKALLASVPHFNEIANRVEGKAGDENDSNGNVSITIRLDVPRPTAVLGPALPASTEEEHAG